MPQLLSEDRIHAVMDSALVKSMYELILDNFPLSAALKACSMNDSRITREEGKSCNDSAKHTLSVDDMMELLAYTYSEPTSV